MKPSVFPNQLPAWAMELLHDPRDLEFDRLRQEGDALEFALHFADRLLQRGVEPTSELVRAALATLEPEGERLAEVEVMAWYAINWLAVHNPTDAGNARRFAAQHVGVVRHCSAWGGWLVWDGRRWARDQR